MGNGRPVAVDNECHTSKCRDDLLLSSVLASINVCVPEFASMLPRSEVWHFSNLPILSSNPFEESVVAGSAPKQGAHPSFQNGRSCAGITRNCRNAKRQSANAQALCGPFENASQDLD